ncbi:phage/plasmid primase, P4 family [Kitasatospora sp. NPDC049285]|uniref:DNA primase family protein n=1 Tax=Kitasatospora sp. NPDC049285 TaxID=3157096 RepID=UPI00343C5E46
MTIPPQPPSDDTVVNALPSPNPIDLARAREARRDGQSPARPTPAPRPVEMHRGQLRFAERFIHEHGRALRYVHGIGWDLWDQHRWKSDEKRVETRAVRQTLKSALRELDRYEGKERDELYQDIRRCESKSGMAGIAEIAGALFPVSTAASEMDSHPHLFNTPGGTVDLQERNIRPARREDLITKLSRGSITGDISQDWENFLARVLPDEEVRAFVQRLFGYAMLGRVTEHVLPIFTGTGANGKGTLRDAIMHTFGDYADEADPAILMESKNERHGAFKMALKGQRLVFCSETDRDKRFAEATMKRLVGGDPIQANWMHSNPITFDPSHTLVMLTNYLPKVSADDPAVWRRLLVVPFDVVIPEDERDPELPAKLRAAADAVLSWVYEGWLAYQKQGLNPPDAVRARTQAYQEDNNAIGRFLEERTMANPHSAVRARELYTAWSTWCRSVGEQAGSEKAFASLMESAGYSKKSTKVGRQYSGLMLLDEEDQEDEESGWPTGARRSAPQPPAEPVQGEIPAAR